eukprot:scaffold4126_cov383-Prasinococcus_capsulatus_cf.AAC.13
MRRARSFVFTNESDTTYNGSGAPPTMCSANGLYFNGPQALQEQQPDIPTRNPGCSAGFAGCAPIFQCEDWVLKVQHSLPKYDPHSQLVKLHQPLSGQLSRTRLAALCARAVILQDTLTMYECVGAAR